MRVSRLEVFGFKSFMDRLVLPLEAGVTGVVGPNGCGKSNIVDALRWVFGESKASNLRGGTLEDVIFNGTDKLRPLGLAEVTITLRASDGNFFSDLRLVEEEAELLAAASKVPTEPIDVDAVPGEENEAGEIPADTEMAPDIQISRPHLTVIQGSLGAQPEEQAAPPPEPAQSASPLLTRFGWLKTVAEVQLTRRLYRSGESEYFINRVPCRLKDIKEFFRAVGLGARAHTIVAQGEVARIVTSKPEDRRLILEEAAGVLGFRDKIASSKRRLEETALNISRLDDIIKEVDRQVATLKRQASRAEARAEIKARIAELDRVLYVEKLRDINQRVSASQSGAAEQQAIEERAASALARVQASEQEARAKLMSVDLDADSIRSQIDARREEVNAQARQRAEKQARQGELRAFGLARQTEIRRLEERLNTLTQRSSECGREIEVLRQKDLQLAQELSSPELSSEEELKNAATNLQNLRDELRRQEHLLRGVRDRLVGSQAEAKSIREQLIAASPINQLKKTLEGEGMDAEMRSLLAQMSAETRLFIEGLHVPAEYSKAVQAVLAERGEFLVSERPFELARMFAEGVLARDPQNTKSIGLGILRAGVGAGTPTQSFEVPFQSLLSLISVDAQVDLAAKKIFERVYLVPSLEAALGYIENSADKISDSGITLVTQAGDILTDYSFFSLRHEGGLIQIKNRLHELDDQTRTLEAEQSKINATRDEIQGQIEQAEAHHAETLRISRDRQSRLRDYSNQQGNVRGRLQAEERQLGQIGQDIEKTKGLITEAEQKISEFKQEADQLQVEIDAPATNNEAELKAEIERLGKDYAALDGIRKLEREKLAACAEEVNSARESLDLVRQSISQASLELQKLDLESQHVRERVTLEYGQDQFEEYLSLAQSEATAVLDEAAFSEYSEEVTKLKSRVAREGDVDLTSIERYQEESKRLQDLEAQRHDLNAAAATLQRTIERLTETSEQRFVATFNAVKENFSNLIPRLFGGGRGSIELLDPAKPLESGVEIIARPPGKKLKSIDLLSGGEKALCATALIMAMFMVRPSPLCVLDEVDAPLDEANLVRFLSMIKEMSTKTQFLMITHNKQSMQAADSLIGVTMQEPGASKVISVSLQEAFAQVA